MTAMNKQSALRGAGTKCLVLVVTILIACLTSTTTCFCLQGTRLSVPLLPASSGISPSRTRLARRHYYYYYMSADGSSDNKEESPQQEQEQDDAAALQKQVEEMFPNTDDNQQEDSLNLYNAAPLFTGGILTVVSIAFTAYLFYAGITGDDPLMGHPK